MLYIIGERPWLSLLKNLNWEEKGDTEFISLRRILSDFHNLLNTNSKIVIKFFKDIKKVAPLSVSRSSEESSLERETVSEDSSNSKILVNINNLDTESTQNHMHLVRLYSLPILPSEKNVWRSGLMMNFKEWKARIRK